MNIHEYFRQNKQKYFPSITNWAHDYNELRERNVKELNWNEWFWFHPSAYNLIQYGSRIIFFLVFSGITTFCALTQRHFLTFFMGVFSILTLIDLAKTIKNHHLSKNTSFYDIYLREY